MEWELDEGAVCEWFHSNYVHSEYLLKEAREGFGDFRIGGQVIRSVKYAE
jgi:hypothetical protein